MIVVFLLHNPPTYDWTTETITLLNFSLLNLHSMKQKRSCGLELP